LSDGERFSASIENVVAAANPLQLIVSASTIELCNGSTVPDPGSLIWIPDAGFWMLDLKARPLVRVLLPLCSQSPTTNNR
jgi:hypothetical protein